MIPNRHVFAKPPECHILASYQMWFCRKLLKNAKYARQIVMIWLFLWNPHLVVLKSATSGFLAFLRYFWPKIAQKRQKPEVGDFDATRSGFSQKSPNLVYLTVFFWRFWAIFGKTISGSSPKCDIFNPWAEHVCVPVPPVVFTTTLPLPVLEIALCFGIFF